MSQLVIFCAKDFALLDKSNALCDFTIKYIGATMLDMNSSPAYYHYHISTTSGYLFCLVCHIFSPSPPTLCVVQIYYSYIGSCLYHLQPSTVYTHRRFRSVGASFLLLYSFTSGQERNHSLAPIYYCGVAAIIVIYDISSIDTFVKAKKWVEELQVHGSHKLVMALVANKLDLEPNREVEVEEGEQFAHESEMFYIETSTKTGDQRTSMSFSMK
ncbi:hypothetical protein AHAS_Ahas16G0115800 [Arachis hypogaea]